MLFNKNAINKDRETSSFQDKQTNPDQSKILGYTAGAYGTRIVKACSSTQHLEEQGMVLNEWELIPQEDKDILINWLNENINFDKDLLDHSIRAYETHPAMEILLKEGTIQKPEPRKDTADFFPENDPTIALLEHSHEEAKPFMDAFLKYIDNKAKMVPIFNWSKLRLGFFVKDEIHFVKLSLLNPIWAPKTQPQLFNEAKTKMLKNSAKNDTNLNKIFRTTSKNDMGPDWAGILTLNVAPMSTLPNGIQNALQLPMPRYKIEWINTKTRESITEYYESVLISTMIEDQLITETTGREKANIHPYNAQVPYDETKVLIGKEREQYLNNKELSRINLTPKDVKDGTSPEQRK